MFGQNRFLYLLIALLLVILVFPVIEELERGRWLFNLFSSAILLSAVYAVNERKGYFILALILAIPALALGWTANFLDSSLASFRGQYCHGSPALADCRSHSFPCSEGGKGKPGKDLRGTQRLSPDWLHLGHFVFHG